MRITDQDFVRGGYLFNRLDAVNVCACGRARQNHRALWILQEDGTPQAIGDHIVIRIDEPAQSGLIVGVEDQQDTGTVISQGQHVRESLTGQRVAFRAALGATVEMKTGDRYAVITTRDGCRYCGRETHPAELLAVLDTVSVEIAPAP
jgi:hypothetical protein